MGLSAGTAYVGPWINYSKGVVLGSTLTIPSKYGNILVAILALLVTWTGTHFWGLICFTLHHLRSSSLAKDGLHYQQQALLRSQKPGTAILYRLLEVGFAWRANTRGAFRRTVPLFVITFVNISVFLAAGIFSSRVTSINSEVLARGKCGFLKGITEDKPIQEWTAVDTAIGDVLNSAGYTSYREENAHARACYGNQLDRSTALCDIFTVSLIPSTRDDNAPCPFAGNACLAAAISFDTGRISSDTHFGINSRFKNRVEMRKKMTCAPVAAANYSSDWTTEQKEGVALDYTGTILPYDSYKYVNLGPSLSDGSVYGNYTVAFSNLTLAAQDRPYSLLSITYWPQNLNKSMFQPIPEFSRNDADVTIIFRNTKLIYTQPVTDPWFKATKKQELLPALKDLYVPEETIAAVGCIEQYQFCNGDKCTPLSGGYALALHPEGPSELGLNPLQSATYKLMVTYTDFMQLDTLLQYLKNEVLLASQLVYGSSIVSSAVEPNQWQTEMENLFNVTLVGLQSHGLYHAAPGNTQIKPGVNLHDFITPETTPENLRLCENQKFRSTDYSSFNLLGLCLILSISFVIITLNMVLPMTVAWLLGLKSGGSASKAAWIEDDVLQLQRMALELRGVGPWKATGASVPVIEILGLEFQRGRYVADRGSGSVQYESVHTEDGRKY